MFENVSDYALFSLDLEGRVSSWNTGAERLFGWSEEEILGLDAGLLYTSADRASGVHLQEQKIARETGRAEDERWHVRKDGSQFYASGVMTPIRDETLRGYAKVCRDVTERVRAHDERAKLAETLGLALGAADLGTWEWDPATDVITLSERASAIFGLPHQGNHLREGLRYLIHPDYRGPARDAATRAVATHSDYDVEYLLDRPGPHKVWVAARGRGVYDSHGSLIRMLGVVQDISARKEAIAELQDIRSRMEAALAAGAIGTWAWDVQADRFYGDASLARLFSVALEDVSGGPIGKVVESIHPDDRERVGRLVNEAVESGTWYEADYRVAQADGTWKWVTARGRVERDESGRAVRFPGVVIDVTDRKRAEEELAQVTAESERRKRLYETILANTPDFAYVFDLEHRFTFANEVLLRMWGKTWSESIGRTCLELGYEPWHAEMHDREIEHVKATKMPVRGEVPFNGTFGPRVYEYIFVPVIGSDGEVEAVAGTTRDITDRKAFEENLKKQTERLELLWEAAEVLLTTEEPDAMMRGLFNRIAPHFGLDVYFNFMVDESGGALRLESCLGITSAAVESIQKLEFGQAICGAVAVKREPITATYIQQSDEPRVQLVKGFGIRVYTCNPLMANGRLLGTLSFASRSRDTFEPDELDFLRTVCQYVTAAYERVRLIRALRLADRKKDDFIALLAHELRNPLAPIRTGLQVLRLAGGDAKAATKAREMMDRQLTHMVRLIDDLLDVSRISRNKMKLRKKRIALADVVASAVETARPLVDEAGHELTISLPAAAIWLDADLTRLAQVFSNLLANSAKYTPPNGRICLAAERSEGKVTVSVSDSGIGIPQASLPTIFEMFNQVDSTMDRSAGGLGIGLGLVRGLVEMHGGEVSAHSAGPGLGSTFTVTLPILPEVASPSLDQASRFLEHAPTRKILVVDDSRDGAESMAEMLRLLGHEVRIANDGIEAIERAEAFRPELILMDVGMPRLNGLDAARKIREQPWGERMAVVALTGWGQENDRADSKAAGCDEHLVKPVSLADLEKVLALVEANGHPSQEHLRHG